MREPDSRDDGSGDDNRGCEAILLSPFLFFICGCPFHLAHDSPPPGRLHWFLHQRGGHAALENIRWQISALLSAQRARCDDPGRGKRFDWCGYVALTAFAGYDEGLKDGVGTGEHAKPV